MCVLFTGGFSFAVNATSLSATSLNISWELVLELVHGVIVNSYTISYNHINTECFNDSNIISDIDGSKTMYILTGLEEGSNYSITVTATLCESGETEGESITATTLAAGKIFHIIKS